MRQLLKGICCPLGSPFVHFMSTTMQISVQDSTVLEHFSLCVYTHTHKLTLGNPIAQFYRTSDR